MIDYTGATGRLLKRALESGAGDDGKYVYDIPTWGWILILVDLVVFLVPIIFASYTLAAIYPTLAIIEDPEPPAYDPVALNDDADPVSEEGAAAQRTRNDDDAAGRPWKPITSSLRSINRLLYSVGGWRANFRGAACAIVLAMVSFVITGFFVAVPFVPTFFGSLIASLILVQLSTAWVHIVISAPRGAPFYRRLPPFGKTFKATALPVTVAWGAATLSALALDGLAILLGLDLWDPYEPTKVPDVKSTEVVWKAVVIIVASVLLTVLVIVPTHVILVRVQASMLPPDEDAIVPFDRSFGGKAQPVVVGGPGYVSMREAITTFPRSSWRRLYVLYVKAYLVTLGMYLLMCAVVIPEVIVIAKKTNRVPSSS